VGVPLPESRVWPNEAATVVYLVGCFSTYSPKLFFFEYSGDAIDFLLFDTLIILKISFFLLKSFVYLIANLYFKY